MCEFVETVYIPSPELYREVRSAFWAVALFLFLSLSENYCSLLAISRCNVVGYFVKQHHVDVYK
ncbi:unnamed protein product [Ixodes hexagonus]